MILQGRRSRAAATLVAVVVAALTSLPGSAAARESRPSDGDLSPRLAELAKPSVRTAPPTKQAAILDVAPSGPGSLLREDGRVLVNVRFDHGAVAGVDALQEAGAKIISASPRYQTVAAAVAPGFLREVASVPRVEAVTESLTPMLSGVGDSGPVASTIRLCFGAATSEGDTQLNAMRARDAFSVDGSGVTVGILSDSFARDVTAATSAAMDVFSGDLPGIGNPCEYRTPVDQRLDTYAGADASDEGRGMAQIVHDLAPAARLAFATAFDGPVSFADNIRALATAGAEVIVDDVVYLEEPFFQEGPIGVAVSDVTDDGVTYFSAAGNNNIISGRQDIASWEAPGFRDSLTCPASLLAIPGLGANHCMDFDPGVPVDTTFGFTVSSGVTLVVDLQWAQPWYGVTTDLDAFLLDSNGNLLSFEGGLGDNVGDTQQPFEALGWENDTGSSKEVQLVINRCSGICNPVADTGAPRLKFALMQNGGGVTAPEYTAARSTDTFGPTIFGHNGSEDAVSVGAIRYSTTTAPENFSSRGPVTHYFGPVVDRNPAAPITPNPKQIDKPDIVATNGGANTFFGACSSNRIWRFFGTSASAPHAAAVAALELQAVPASSPDEVKRAQFDTALDIPGFPATAAGAGIIDAYGAIESLKGESPAGSQTQQATAPNCPPPSPPPPGSTPAPTTAPTVFAAPSVKRDRTRPQTQITKKPPKVSFTREESKQLVFRFSSSEPGSSFLCKIDRGRFHQCHRKVVRWFRVGEHVLQVKARDVAGNVDRTPAVYSFTVKRAG